MAEACAERKSAVAPAAPRRPDWPRVQPRVMVMASSMTAFDPKRSIVTAGQSLTASNSGRGK